MPSPTRLTRTALVLVVGLLASLLATGAGSAAVAADDKGIVNGSISCPQLSKCPGLKLIWFDQDWNYVGQRKLGGGAHGYSLTLPVGTYRLQFVDQRASYDISKYAPTDAQVTVKANQLSVRNVTMQKGAAITGTAKNGKGHPLGGATIVAANKGEQSFSTQANSKGQFAVGGLPQGQYSVFTYDKSRTWVGKSTWAGSVKPGNPKNLGVKLTKRAGQMTVYLFTPNGLLGQKTTLTVTSRQTGQWWSATSGNGTFVFKGLYAGGYDAQFDGVGVWFAKTGAVQKANVKPNGFTSGEFRLTKRGGWIVGHIVDGDGNRMVPLKPGYTNGPGATIRLFNEAGDEIATTTSDAEGAFKLQGQLATQEGLTIAVDPPVETGYYMNGEARCMFDHAEFSGYTIVTGEERYVGQLPVPRTPDQEGIQCATRD